MNYKTAALSDQKEWDVLLTEAKNTLQSTSAEQVLLMQSGKQIYKVVFDSISNGHMTERLLPVLNESANAKMDRLVCMWSNDGLDLPAFSVRDLLCKSNPENMTTKILGQGLHSLIVKELGETMPRDYPRN